MTDAIEDLIKVQNLTLHSTPCEICRAMNGVKVETKYVDRGLFKQKWETEEEVVEGTLLCRYYDYNACLSVDKARLRIAFLELARNYLR